MALEEEIQTKLTEVLRLSANQVARRLSELLNKAVTIQYTEQGDSKWQDAIAIEEDSVLVKVDITEPALGPVAAVLSKKTAYAISDLMAGGTGEIPEELDFNEDKQAAFKEAISQAISAAKDKIAGLKEDAAFAVSETEIRVLEKENAESLALPEGFAEPINVSLKLSIEGIEDSTITVELNTEAATNLAETYSELAAAENADSDDGVNASGVDFLDQSGSGPVSEVDEEKNLGLLMDISMGLTVELGRSEMDLKDILKLGKGSIIELDRLAGEPVDLFVNNKLIARGEVVVIDDNFGLRVTQLAGSLNIAEEMGLKTPAAAA